MQLVIYGRARKVMQVQWTFGFTHAAPGAGLAGAAPRRGRGDDPQLPL